MKYKIKFFLTIIFIAKVFAVGEAGAVFLLINPGSRAAGAGEAQVAKADDAYASYYNPAGLGFLRGQEVVMQHVNWLPNLTSDIFYDFIAYRRSVAGLGTFGGHIIFLNLGTQQGMDEWNNQTGEFKSYMAAINFSYGTQLSDNKSVGMNVKVFHQKLSDRAQAGETGDPFSTDFGFDIGYLQKFGKRNQHQFGFSIQNIGPPIDFIDAQQADPAPTNMRLGVYTEIFKSDQNKLHFLFDANKLLVASFPSMDWDGDGLIGAGDGVDFMNSEGQNEDYYSDPWYKGVFTSWLDDWYYGGDYDLCDAPCGQSILDIDITHSYGDGRDQRIGGYFAMPGYSYINNDDLYKQFTNLAGKKGEFADYWLGDVLYDVTENHLDANNIGLPTYFSADWHEPEYHIGEETILDEWRSNPSVYPSYTKSLTLEAEQSGYLNSLDFLIKHFPLLVEDKTELVEDALIYIPNHEGFCEKVYTNAGGSFFADGKTQKVQTGSQIYGHSMCYSLDPQDFSATGQPYYKYENTGTYASPKWVRVLNDEFNMNQLTYLDLPHDGMGEFDKFYYNCDAQTGECEEIIKGLVIVNDKDDDDACTGNTNDDDWVCGPGDEGITEDELSYRDESSLPMFNGQFYYDISLENGEGEFDETYGPNLYDYFGEKSFDDPRYGDYNAQSNLERGSGKQREFKDELEEMIYNFGLEWSYTDNFIMRLGFIYDLEGDIKNPTFGAGVNFDKYGFDFGYTAGEKGHPRENTMFFSLSLGL